MIIYIISIGKHSNAHLIKQRLEEISEMRIKIIDYKTPKLLIKIKKADAIIISGSHLRVRSNPTIIDPEILSLGIPVLGICFGWQWMAANTAGIDAIKSFPNNEFHVYRKLLKIQSPFLVCKCMYQFRHHDYVSNVPDKWEIGIQDSNTDQIWLAFDNVHKHIGVQFHPESLEPSSNMFFAEWLKWISN